MMTNDEHQRYLQRLHDTLPSRRRRRHRHFTPDVAVIYGAILILLLIGWGISR